MSPNLLRRLTDTVTIDPFTFDFSSIGPTVGTKRGYPAGVHGQWFMGPASLEEAVDDLLLSVFSLL